MMYILYIELVEKCILFRYDKLIHRGSIAIFCEFSLYPVRNCISNIDVNYIHFKINSISFNIICVYRPPNCNVVISHEHICKVVNITQQNTNSYIIIEDFNLLNFYWKEYIFPNYPTSYVLL